MHPSVPQISVVMPVYNCQRYLAEAMESVLAQTLGDFELIVVDDGSTDDSKKIVERYAAKDGRIQLISRPNTGIVGALNDGLGAARAPYLARMDGDDIALSQRFEKQFQYMESHPDCCLVGSRVILIDADGDPIREWVYEETHEAIDSAHLIGGWPVVHPTVMMRTQMVRDLGGYREEFKWLEDLDLFLRLAEHGRLANLPEPLLKYRKHQGSVCHLKQEEQYRVRQLLYRDTHQRRGLPPPVAPAPREIWGTRQEHLLWGWWALGAGHVSTARKYAKTVLREAPFSKDTWRLMYCAIRGH
jgi:glycosyltransferase involved in cell wall biosynthesis